MSVSLKERCRKVISQQNLSGETARLFSEDVKDGALNAQTVRLLLDDMRREFQATVAEHPYVRYLDDEARPPLAWHEKDMAMFRPLLDERLGTSDE